MRLAVTAFTRRGAVLAKRLVAALEAGGDLCDLSLPAALDSGGYAGLTAWTGERFRDREGLVFVGACAIAVRAVAPFVKDKLTDPAVVAVDERGAFVVPLLSGHVGGANDLARRIAGITGGQAAVSTATDVNGVFAVDQWAARQGFALVGREAAKHISAALLEGGNVGFQSDFPVEGECPAGVTRGSAPLGFAVTLDLKMRPFDETLFVVPRCLRLGIGCRRGATEADIAGAVTGALALNGLPWEAVEAVCTIDRKEKEPGLVEFCGERGVRLLAYSAEALRAVPGAFSGSTFVEETVGVDNVCERSAMLEGGKLVVRKRARDSVTVAVAMKDVVVRF